jgi:hypothetical protein
MRVTHSTTAIWAEEGEATVFGLRGAKGIPVQRPWTAPKTLTGRLDFSCHRSLRCFGRESVDGATQAITTLINSRACSGVEGKVL